MNTINKLISQLKCISSDALVLHLLGEDVISIIVEAAARLDQHHKPLSKKQIKQMQERHFTPEYIMRLSDELCLSWYALGVRDCEKAHGIGDTE